MLNFFLRNSILLIFFYFLYQFIYQVVYYFLVFGNTFLSTIFNYFSQYISPFFIKIYLFLGETFFPFDNFYQNLEIDINNRVHNSYFVFLFDFNCFITIIYFMVCGLILSIIKK